MSENDPHIPIWNNDANLSKGIFGEDNDSPKPLLGVRLKLDLYCILEVAAVIILGFAIAHFYVGGVLGFKAYINSYVWSILGLPALLGIILQRTGMYQLSAVTSFASSLSGVTWGVFNAFALTALTATALGITDNFSRVWFGSWFAGSVGTLWTLRAIGTRFFSSLKDSGAARRRTVLVGYDKELKSFLDIYGEHNPHYQFVSWFGKQANLGKSGLKTEMRRLVDLWSTSKFDLVIVAPEYSNPEQLNFILNEIGMLSVEIKVLPPSALSTLPMLGISSQGEQKFIDIQHSRVTYWGRFLKALEDYSIAAVSTVLLSLPLLIIAIAIRMESPGPVLYRQRRTGLNNQEFMIYKFRTMVSEQKNKGLVQTGRTDKRVTRVGRFLRKTSLDELPQLFNVLKGEMSLVGPRPHPIELNEAYEPLVNLFNKRHSVKPGITGWAQIHDHRGPVDTALGMQRRLNYDLYYVDNWSLWFDLKVIMATPFLSLTHKNAY